MKIIIDLYDIKFKQVRKYVLENYYDVSPFIELVIFLYYRLMLSWLYIIHYNNKIYHQTRQT